MIAYHFTKRKNIKSIMQFGIMPNKIGIVYLTPSPLKFPSKYREKGMVCLKVETEKLKLTAFEDCRDWEILCWGRIMPRNIKVYKYDTIKEG